ncbi:putative phosphoglycerate mutase family protein [Phaeoacremonium minimum UCRPA7]|uniref:Putative phosphoglycerate mutase family protein n=1 Tax=Phaeoacremonium minimum (strain UCR-PA7) TaxID=1286976 RepID=R8BKM5_PHAM7|nr:putative phosphoglycerate mutase family protein [Phaeoacremonium minimum UCRPA7]EON99762.1 putative phosphoglycerate mutase family protein [Phaeoacremonium minimum UCRPA7]
MPITLHLVRHAQGFHNLSLINQQISDPSLTPFGREQCAELCKAFPAHDKITHLVASPMRRAIQTCYLSFQPAATAGKKVIAIPEVQEVSTLPSDIGTDPRILQIEFEDIADLSHVKPGWNDKSAGTPWSPTLDRLTARAKAARRWLRKLGQEAGGEADIAVVSHGGFLHFLTEDWDGMDPARGTGWQNTEYRSYEFVDPEGDDDVASLRETKPSWRRRRGSAIGLTETEQRELRAVVTRQMEEEFEWLAKEPPSVAVE